MVIFRRTSVLLLAAALGISACGGGSDSNADSGERDASAAADPGNDEATARFVSVELVWAIDGEPVGPSFDYDESIERDRYDAGLRFDATFETTGDLGAMTTDLFLPVTINDDKIRAGRSYGPEQSPTRPDRDEMAIVVTDGGFVAQFPVGRPLSPISLVDARKRSVEFGIDPDEEVVDLGEVNGNQLTFDAAGVSDTPAAPVDGRNDVLIELDGTIEFGNGFIIEVGEDVSRSEIGQRLLVTETTTVNRVISGDCAAKTDRYLELIDDELAEPDVVLLDRVRAFDSIASIVREEGCGPRDFAVPVCEAATAATTLTTVPESLLQPHLDRCPDADDLVEATVYEPRFEDGVVRLVLPTTTDGLPAYSVAISWPAWTLGSAPYVSDGQAISLSADPDVYAGFPQIDIANSAHSRPALFEARAASMVEPEVAGAEIVLADTTTIAGLPARRLIAQTDLETPTFQVGTVLEIDEVRLLTISGTAASTEELPVDGAGLAALMSCVESSIVIVEFEDGVDPAPAADCTLLTALSLSEATPEPVVEPDASYEDSLISITVPGTEIGPAHIVTVATPSWPLGRKISNETRQSIKIDDDESNSMIRVVAEVPEDGETADDPAVLANDEWILVADDVVTVAGREARVVVKEWVTMGSRRGSVLIQLDEEHPLTIEVNIDTDGANDFDAIFAAVLNSVTITP